MHDWANPASRMAESAPIQIMLCRPKVKLGKSALPCGAPRRQSRRFGAAGKGPLRGGLNSEQPRSAPGERASGTLQPDTPARRASVTAKRADRQR